MRASNLTLTGLVPLEYYLKRNNREKPRAGCLMSRLKVTGSSLNNQKAERSPGNFVDEGWYLGERPHLWRVL